VDGLGISVTMVVDGDSLTYERYRKYEQFCGGIDNLSSGGRKYLFSDDIDLSVIEDLYVDMSYVDNRTKRPMPAISFAMQIDGVWLNVSIPLELILAMLASDDNSTNEYIDNVIEKWENNVRSARRLIKRVKKVVKG